MMTKDDKKKKKGLSDKSLKFAQKLVGQTSTPAVTPTGDKVDQPPPTEPVKSGMFGTDNQPPSFRQRYADITTEKQDATTVSQPQQIAPPVKPEETRIVGVNPDGTYKQVTFQTETPLQLQDVIEEQKSQNLEPFRERIGRMDPAKIDPAKWADAESTNLGNAVVTSLKNILSRTPLGLAFKQNTIYSDAIQKTIKSMSLPLFQGTTQMDVGLSSAYKDFDWNKLNVGTKPEDWDITTDAVKDMANFVLGASTTAIGLMPEMAMMNAVFPHMQEIVTDGARTIMPEEKAVEFGENLAHKLSLAVFGKKILFAGIMSETTGEFVTNLLKFSDYPDDVNALITQASHEAGFWGGIGLYKPTARVYHDVVKKLRRIEPMVEKVPMEVAEQIFKNELESDQVRTSMLQLESDRDILTQKANNAQTTEERMELLKQRDEINAKIQEYRETLAKKDSEDPAMLLDGVEKTEQPVDLAVGRQAVDNAIKLIDQDLRRLEQEMSQTKTAKQLQDLEAQYVELENRKRQWQERMKEYQPKEELPKTEVPEAPAKEEIPEKPVEEPPVTLLDAKGKPVSEEKPAKQEKPPEKPKDEPEPTYDENGNLILFEEPKPKSSPEEEIKTLYGTEAEKKGSRNFEDQLNAGDPEGTLSTKVMSSEGKEVRVYGDLPTGTDTQPAYRFKKSGNVITHKGTAHAGELDQTLRKYGTNRTRFGQDAWRLGRLEQGIIDSKGDFYPSLEAKKLKEYEKKIAEEKRQEQERLASMKTKDTGETGELKESEKFKVVDVPLGSLKVDTAEFQNRDTAFNETSVSKMEQGFNIDKFDPIKIWKDPADNKYYVLSGHSRLEFFRRMSAKGNKDFDSIPAKIYEAKNLADARKFATQESNTLATAERPSERAKLYRAMREQGKSEKEIIAEAKKTEVKNSNLVIDLSHLDPKGRTIDMYNKMESTGTEGKRLSEQIMSYIAGVRRVYTELTNRHEEEMYSYLVNKGYADQFRNKSEFIDRVGKIVERLDFDPKNPLKLDENISKHKVERTYDEEIEDLRRQKRDAQKLLEQRRTAYIKDRLNPKTEVGKMTDKEFQEFADKNLVKYENEIQLIEKEILSKEAKKKDAVKEAEESEISLFDQAPDDNLFNQSKEIIKDAIKKPTDLQMGGLQKIGDLLDPKVLRAVYNVGRYLVNKGATKLADFTKQLVSELGAWAKKYAREIWNEVRKSPIERGLLPKGSQLATLGTPVSTPEVKKRTAEVIDGFYSPTEKRLLETRMEKKTAQGWLTSGLIGREEGHWTGLRYFLESKKPQEQVPKEELINYLKDNKVEIQVFRSDTDGQLADMGGLADYSRYTVKGDKKNYTEILITAPSLYNPAPKESPVVYFSDHWNKTNVLAHLRVTERKDVQGKNTLFIEEVQSDWAQEGREKGFRNKDKLDSVELEMQIDEIYDKAISKIADRVGESRVTLKEAMTGTVDQQKAFLLYSGSSMKEAVSAIATIVNEPKFYKEIKENGVVVVPLLNGEFTLTVPSQVTNVKALDLIQKEILANDITYNNFRHNTSNVVKMEIGQQGEKIFIKVWDKEGFNAVTDLYPQIYKPVLEQAIKILEAESLALKGSYAQARQIFERKFIDKRLTIPDTDYKTRDTGDLVKKMVDNTNKVDDLNNDNIVRLYTLRDTKDQWLKEELTPEDRDRLNTLEDDLQNTDPRMEGDSPPPAPYVTDTSQWVKLGLKYAIKEAMDKGINQIAWATGRQNAEHYALSNIADSIVIKPKDTVGDNNRRLEVVTYKDGTATMNAIIDRGQLSDMIGRDLAKKHSELENQSPDGRVVFEGKDLEIGGHGMKAFYGDPATNDLGIVGNAMQSLLGKGAVTILERPVSHENALYIVEMQNGWLGIKDGRPRHLIGEYQTYKEAVDAIRQLPQFTGRFILKEVDPRYIKDGKAWSLFDAFNDKNYTGSFTTRQQAIDWVEKQGEKIASTFQHSVKLTPEIKNRIKTEGQPRYASMIPITERVKALFRGRGHLDQKSYNIIEQHNADMRAYAVRTADNVKTLRKAIKEEYGSKGFRDRDLAKELNTLLQGIDNGVIKPKTKDAIQALRDDIDKHSMELLGIPILSKTLTDTVGANIGRYLTRHYERDYNDKWTDYIYKNPEGQQILETARQYLERENILAGSPKTPEQIEGILYDMTRPAEDLNMFSFGSASNVRMNRETLMKRKDIPPELTALMGEITDPIANYVRSVMKTADMISKHALQEQLRANGMDKVFFTTKTKNDSGAYTELLASADNPAYKTLTQGSDIYTTKEYKDAFEKTFNPYNNPRNVVEQGLRMYQLIMGFTRLGKTALSPTTTARNFISNPILMLVNGYWNFHDLPKAWKMDAKTKEKLTRLEVIGTSSSRGELQDATSDIRHTTGSVDKMTKNIGDRANMLIDKPAEFYGSIDDWFKFQGFKKEMQRYKKAYKDDLASGRITEAELEKQVAQIIRRVTTDYQRVPPIIRDYIRRLPVGNFVSFPYEMMRLSVEIPAQAIKEIRNPKTRSIGIKRMASFAGTMATVSVLPALTKMLTGTSEETENALREFMPSWQKNSQFLHMGRQNDGSYRFVDLSYTDPFNYVRKPLIAFMTADPTKDNPAEIASEMVWETLSPFLSEEILFKAIANIRSNQDDETGKEIYNTEDTFENKVLNIIDYSQKFIAPAFIPQFQRLYKGYKEERSPFKQYNLPDELAGFVGQRVTTMQPLTALSFRASDMQEELAKLTALATKARYKYSEDSAKLQQRLDEVDVLYNNKLDKFRQVVEAGRQLELTDEQIKKQLLLSKISQDNVRLIFSDEKGSLKERTEQSNKERQRTRTRIEQGTLPQKLTSPNSKSRRERIR